MSDYQYASETHCFTSEILCENCLHKEECDPGSDPCDAYRALDEAI
jgi:hypothetical protein